MLTDKRDFLFRFIPVPLRYTIQMDEESLYSVTDQYTADSITKDVCKFLDTPSKHVIVDATACIGGNTYSFAKVFNNVHAIEIDPTRFQYLKDNLSMLNMNNVQCHQGNMMDICTTIHSDLVFIDPPWGGPGYKSQTVMDLYLSGTLLQDVCRKIASNTRFIGLKVPVNFNELGFTEATRDFLKLVYRNERLRKIHFLMFEVY
jgi:RNA cap guanine-N2 methyltransferase